MKQGTNFILPVQIEYDLEQVKSIDFIFKQAALKNKNEYSIRGILKGVEKTFTYPSETATLSETEENVINLYWTDKDTYIFMPEGEPVYMDTRITLNNSTENPETEIVKIQMLPTLFKPELGGNKNDKG